MSVRGYVFHSFQMFEKILKIKKDTPAVSKTVNINLAEGASHRWILREDEEYTAVETPEGLLVKPLDRPLVKVYLEPTVMCNLNCRTCIRNSWDEPTGTMSMDTFTALIKSLEAVPSFRTMAFWGFGEPLMHPEILQMITMANDKGVETELITNGLLLDDRMARGLIEAGLDRLIVSVDGVSSASYETIRKGSNLHRVTANVEKLNRLKRDLHSETPELGMEYVLMKSNLKDFPRLPQLVRSLEASFVIVTNVLPYTEDLKDEILYDLSAGLIPQPSRSKLFPEIVLPRIDAQRETLDTFADLLSQCTGSIDLMSSRRGYVTDFCPFVWEGAAAVSWNGDVSPCVALMHSYDCHIIDRKKRIRSYSLGNVKGEAIGTIWDKEEFQQFRRRVIRFDFPPCMSCGGCDMSESNLEDCFGNPHPTCGDCLWARGIIQCP